MCEVVIFYYTFQIVLKNLGQMLQQSKCTINIQNTLLSVNGPYSADLLLGNAYRHLPDDLVLPGTVSPTQQLHAHGRQR